MFLLLPSGLGVRDVNEAGRISGRIYAISTWGSLLGTYLPVLFVIPLAGFTDDGVDFWLNFVAGWPVLGLWQTKA